MFCPARIPTAVLLCWMAFSPDAGRAQIRYASGQDVVPVFEGWERNPDGSFNMVFGYMNRNYEEQVDVPPGPHNKIEPGPADQGQPGHFYPRRQEFVFKVRVPADWGQKDLVWTLGSHGQVEKAYGSLLPIYELGTLVYLENRRGAGALTFPEEPNKPPAIEMVGSSTRTAIAGQPLTLSVDVTDDGYPKPRVIHARPRAARNNGREGPADPQYPQSPATQAIVKLEPGVRLGVTWILYRAGPGTVSFDPMHVAVVGSDNSSGGEIAGRATTNVTFSEPGSYILRVYADDSVLMAPLDVKVTVQPAAKRTP
jgi:hypothetical protein